jgi:hypothetical protein
MVGGDPCIPHLARIEPNREAVQDDLKPETVPLGFVQPAVSFGWTDGAYRRLLDRPFDSREG